MEWNIYLTVIFILGALFFASGIATLAWAARRGHFHHFNEQARVIFTEEEPEGVCTDSFPR